MKLIIAGSRGYKNYDFLQHTLNTQFAKIGDPSEIVHGNAYGVDTMGGYYALKYKIPQKKFIPDWDKYGKAAGPIRNTQMADYADALFAFWDGKSRGTKNMIDTAKSKGLKVTVFLI